MRIQCPYCQNVIDESVSNCPHCGAPNDGVRRTAKSQPTTIEQLQAWYRDRGLPPYETTRFFLGINYKGARAFGIYKDTDTGEFVVYKNKNDGSRAVRYHGPDEAYAVNEIYQRLKQEILQQKQHSTTRSYTPPSRSPQPAVRRAGGFLGWLVRKVLKICGITAAALGALLMVVLIMVLFEDQPDPGYYLYENQPYYYYINTQTSGDHGWICFEDGQWDTYYTDSDWMPKELRKNRSAKDYFVGQTAYGQLGVPDFTQTEFYTDRLNGFHVSEGYYTFDDRTFYHASDVATYGWYYFDLDNDDWLEAEYFDVPDPLTHSVSSEDFWYTPIWDSSTQITDFLESDAYDSYYASTYESDSSSGSYSSGDSDSSWWDDDDDDDWDWDWDDDWDSGWSDWDSDW